jgi:PTH1 family peptidyl-tRNA hydrolase
MAYDKLDLRVIVGLGNPGARYDGTRHNIGFAVVDILKQLSGLNDCEQLGERARALASRAIAGDVGGALGWLSRDGYLEGDCRIGDWSGTIIKPQSFMNRSGEPLSSFLRFRKLSVEQVAVVHDEIDIPLGALKLKVGGGEGGHNGLRSISERCGGRNYLRVRVGVGKPGPNNPLARVEDGIATWVLSRFDSDELGDVERVVVRSVLAIWELTHHGLTRAQSKFQG